MKQNLHANTDWKRGYNPEAQEGGNKAGKEGKQY